MKSSWFCNLKKWVLRKPVIGNRKYTTANLKQYIEYKSKTAAAKGLLHPLIEELQFVNNKDLQSVLPDVLRKNGVSYKPNKVTVFGYDFQWDFQCSAITTWVRGTADCGGIHRIAQVWMYLQGYTKTYLCSYVASDFEKNHTTTVYLDHDGWYRSFDYGFRGKPCKTVEAALKTVARKYRTSMICYVAQNINYEIINED